MELRIKSIRKVNTDLDPITTKATASFTCSSSEIQYCKDTNSKQYSTTDSIFEWDIYADESDGRLTITNLFNVIQRDFFQFQYNPDGSYNGYITITQKGKYDISLCCYFRTYGQCYSGNVCQNFIPDLFIYKAKDSTASANSIGSNPAPGCLDIGCNQECANKDGYELDVGNILHFKAYNHQGPNFGTGYYRGFVNLVLK